MPGLHLLVNAPLLPEVLLRAARGPQADIPLAADGAQRYVWESRWGAMLIEVVADRVFVNGQPVEPHPKA